MANKSPIHIPKSRPGPKSWVHHSHNVNASFLRTSRSTLSPSSMATTANARSSVHSRILIDVLVYQRKETRVVRRRDWRRRCNLRRGAEERGDEVDGAGGWRNRGHDCCCRSRRRPDCWLWGVRVEHDGTNCGGAADFYHLTASAYAASHHTNGGPTISSVSVAVDVPMPLVKTQEVFRQVPVPVMKPVDVLLVKSWTESWRSSATDRGMPSSCASGNATKGNSTRDEWNHLLCLFNISHFSSINSVKAMSKRTQEDADEERVTAKSKPMMNLVSRYSVRDPNVLASTASESWVKTKSESQLPLSSWNEQHQRTGRPVLGASSSNYSEWNIADKWSSQNWKSDEILGARTERPEDDKFVIDDDMDSDTAQNRTFV